MRLFDQRILCLLSPWASKKEWHAKPCCQLDKPAQEFHCQGLVLDLPIVCWGDDVWWDEGWKIKRGRANPLVNNPDQFRINTYRVLMTRGREGLVIFVPPGTPKMDAIAERLIRCGGSTLETRRARAVTIADAHSAPDAL